MPRVWWHPQRGSDQALVRVALVMAHPDTGDERGKATLGLVHPLRVVANEPAEVRIIVERLRERASDRAGLPRRHLADVAAIRPRAIRSCWRDLDLRCH